MSARPLSLFLKVKESVADLDHVLRRVEGLGMVLIRVELERHALRDLGRRSIGVVRGNRRGGGCRALTDLVAGIARLTRRRGGRSLRGIAHLHRSRIGSVRAIGSAVWLLGPLPDCSPACDQARCSSTWEISSANTGPAQLKTVWLTSKMPISRTNACRARGG